MNELLKSLTFRLMPRPSFLEGMARTLDIGGGLSTYNFSTTGAEADFRAMASDWFMVGQDFAAAMGKYEQETNQQAKA